MPIQAYPWTLLNTTRGWSNRFNSAGTYDNYLVQFSISGVLASTDLRVELDGKDLGWEVNPVIGLDRFIYNMKFDEALSAGSHELKFTLLNEELQGTAQLCNLEILEYGEADEFNFAPEFHGSYPTYSATNQTTYRPTNDMCLMRSMYSVDFCDACIEGLWLSLLNPLSLIDNVTQVAQTDGFTNVTLDLLPVAQFRDVPRETESYSVQWFNAADDSLLDEFTNKTTALVSQELAEVEVVVRFSSAQIRSEGNGVLVERETFEVKK
jgi:hypothetical protein